MKRILLIGAQHGNEFLGEKLYGYIKRNRRDLLPNVSYLIGNPKARKLGVRYIETDLNRSYVGKRNTYEQRRACKILQYIERGGFDLVLDLHTTSTFDQPLCLISKTIDCSGMPFLHCSSINSVVHMQHEMAATSLIGNCSQAISIEVNADEVNEALLMRLTADIVGYISGVSAGYKTIYEVRETLLKTELSRQQVKALHNFKMSKHGFYPVLVGENSYKKCTDYLGFKAAKTYRLSCICSPQETP